MCRDTGIAPQKRVYLARFKNRAKTKSRNPQKMSTAGLEMFLRHVRFANICPAWPTSSFPVPIPRSPTEFSSLQNNRVNQSALIRNQIPRALQLCPTPCSPRSPSSTPLSFQPPPSAATEEDRCRGLSGSKAITALRTRQIDACIDL